MKKKIEEKSGIESKMIELNKMLDSLRNNDIPLEEAVEVYKNAMLIYNQCVSDMEKIKLEIKTIDGIELNI